jgi:hypothetical protein
MIRDLKDPWIVSICPPFIWTRRGQPERSKVSMIKVRNLFSKWVCGKTKALNKD